jgi:hypothetical protein
MVLAALPSVALLGAREHTIWELLVPSPLNLNVIAGPELM